MSRANAEDKFLELMKKIKRLEDELAFEIQKKEDEFFYEIHAKRVKFQRTAKIHHKLLIKKIRYYLRDAAVMNIVTAPVIYAVVVPAFFLDLFITLYQSICFPIYGIPKVRRQDYIVTDRKYLHYLNLIEKINCYYCGYFNGLMGYTQEIAGRTEQYWCPIKHARKLAFIHGRYRKFFEYGDADTYRENLEKVRREFDDLLPGKNPVDKSGK
ncbi:MAG: hypothetical protein ACE5G9_01870 [Nitrospinales bacterium]